MKHAKRSLSAILLLIFIPLNTLIAQNFKDISVYKNNGDILNLKGKLVANKLSSPFDMVKINEGNKTNTLNLSEITKIIINNETFLSKNIDESIILLKEIEKGNLSLFVSNGIYFLENEKYGIKKLPFKVRDGLKLSTFEQGIVKLFAENCKETVEQVYDNADRINVKMLKKIVSNYNSCNTLNNDVYISEKTIENANLPKEKFYFGIAIGTTFLNSDMSNLNINETLKNNAIELGGFLEFVPNILDRKLHFNLTLNYFFKDKNQFKDNLYYVSSEISYYNIMLGSRYLFLNDDNKLSPYIGFKGGIYSYTNSSILVKPSTIGTPNNIYTGNSTLAFNLEAGTFFKLLNQDFNFNISYLPTTEFSLKNNNPLYSGNDNY